MGKGRAPCCDKNQVKKGPWSPAEDLKLIAFIQKYGHENWRALPKQAGLLRCGKSCRLRWINYLRPDVKRGNFTADEEETIIRLHKTMGNKWSKIASRLPGRTDNEIKNVWNTHLKKRLAAKTSDSSADESKVESSVTSPSSSSSESIFSNEAPNMEKTSTNHGNEVGDQSSQVTVSEKNEQDSGKQVFSNNEEVVGITEVSKESSISLSSVESNNNILNSTSKIVEHKPEQQILDSPLPYLGPYDVDNTLEEVDKPKHMVENQLETDNDFWKLLDNLESFLSNEVRENTIFEDGSVQDAEARMWSHEFENEFGVGEKNESNKDQFIPKDNKAEEGMDIDTFNLLDLVTRPESELDLGYIQLWPQNNSP